MATEVRAGEAGTGAHRFTRAVLVCPRCGNDLAEAVCDGYRTNFRCLLCLTCWHIGVNGMEAVDVRRCPGCKYAHECESTPLP